MVDSDGHSLCGCFGFSCGIFGFGSSFENIFPDSYAGCNCNLFSSVFAEKIKNRKTTDHRGTVVCFEGSINN